LSKGLALSLPKGPVLSREELIHNSKCETTLLEMEDRPDKVVRSKKAV